MSMKECDLVVDERTGQLASPGLHDAEIDQLTVSKGGCAVASIVGEPSMSSYSLEMAGLVHLICWDNAHQNVISEIEIVKLVEAQGHILSEILSLDYETAERALQGHSKPWHGNTGDELICVTILPSVGMYLRAICSSVRVLVQT